MSAMPLRALSAVPVIGFSVVLEVPGGRIELAIRSKLSLLYLREKKSVCDAGLSHTLQHWICASRMVVALDQAAS
jgi:hypothetical protein